MARPRSYLSTYLPHKRSFPRWPALLRHGSSNVATCPRRISRGRAGGTPRLSVVISVRVCVCVCVGLSFSLSFSECAFLSWTEFSPKFVVLTVVSDCVKTRFGETYAAFCKYVHTSGANCTIHESNNTCNY